MPKSPQSVDLPPLYRVAQHFDQPHITDVPAVVRNLFASFDPGQAIKPGQRVAVGVASRGTHDLKELVQTSIACLRQMGLEPYVTPAMGSHGGGTGQGQTEVLAGLGITEASVGAPVIASGETVRLGCLESGAEIFFAQDALQAEHVMVINRVKPHTAFRGEVESGLCKILAVGLGRQPGAAIMHKFDLGQTIVPAARLIMSKVPVLCGLAVTETASGHTHDIRLAGPQDFVAIDRELLKQAWTLLPLLPIDHLDILIVDEMGKNISGAGMDPNVVGFWRREGGQRRPDYRCLVVLDLTPASHGNAHGIGMADLTTRQLMAKADLQATYVNSLSSGVLRAGRLPIPMDNDLRAIQQAMQLVARPDHVRMARIRNTSALGTFWISAKLRPELLDRPGLAVGETPRQLSFNDDGKLLPAE